MKCSLEIRNGTETVLSRELEPGEYAIGRKDGNDIVLADKSISGKHAVITVGKKKVVVADAGSRNGVLLQGKRINSQSFSKDFSIQLGPFLLHFGLGAAPAQKASKSKEAPKTVKASKSLFASLNPRILVYGVLFCFALFMAVAYYAPLNAGWESGRKREALTRGILLARYLGAVNQLPLEEKRMDVLRTDPSNTEEGVRFAYVVDPYGKILAPAQEMGKFLKLRTLDTALSDARLRVWKGGDGEQVIFYPIKNFDTLLGAAIIGYDLKRAVAVQGGGHGGTAALLFFLSLGVAGLCGLVLLRGFLSPLRALAEDAGVSLKQRQDHVGFQAAYAELRTLVEAMNRMLLLVAKSADAPVSARREEPPRPVRQAVEPVEQVEPPQPKQPAPPPAEPVRPAAPAGNPDLEATNILLAPPVAPETPSSAADSSEKTPEPVAEAGPAPTQAPIQTPTQAPPPEEPSQPLLANDTVFAQEAGQQTDQQPDQQADRQAEAGADIGSVPLPACHIDLQQYTIVGFNPGFCAFFAGGEKKQGMHMLEAFPDPELISAISTLIDDRQPEAESVVGGERVVYVRKQVLPGEAGIALFTFKESADG